MNRQLDPAQTGFAARKLQSDLKQRVVGQDEAIQQIVDIYQTHLSGMSSPGRPLGNLLFLGPTGSGKTRLVEATAESLVGDSRAVIRIDCAEFQHSHEIAKLIGSPPGYLGHRETHPLLSQETLNQHNPGGLKISFVLFDEIEKASDALWNLLLGILDKASLTLGDNRRVDFSRALIFMTSNLGASEMSSILRPNLGFAAGQRCMEDDRLACKISRAAVEAARRKFTPEFINRLDKLVVFHPLGEKELSRILTLELNIVQQRIFQSASALPFVFSVSEPAREFLLQEGIDPKYGARHLKRAIDRHLVHPLSNLIASDQIRGGDLIRIDYDADLFGLTFFTEQQGMSPEAMLQMIEVPPAATRNATPAAAVTEIPRPAAAKMPRR
jgi:ATP-dependent Clp protease ATP-binding subunit ClpA